MHGNVRKKREKKASKRRKKREHQLKVPTPTKLEVCIIGADVVEGTHESLYDKSNAHGLVDAIELRDAVRLHDSMHKDRI